MATEIKVYQDGSELLITTDFLCAYKNVDRKTVSGWIKKGLPKHKRDFSKSNLFMIDEVNEWQKINLNENKQRNSNSKKVGEEDLDEQEKSLEEIYEQYTKGSFEQKRKILMSLPQNMLDNFKKMEEILEKEYKNRESDKEWVRAEKPANAIRELVILFISSLKNSIPVLSKELEHKTQDENATILDREFGMIINNIRKTASLETDEEEKLITIIEEIKNRLLDGDTVKNILERVRDERY